MQTKRASVTDAKRRSLTANIERAIADLTVCLIVVSRETHTPLPMVHVERLKGFVLDHIDRAGSDFEFGDEFQHLVMKKEVP